MTLGESPQNNSTEKAPVHLSVDTANYNNSDRFMGLTSSGDKFGIVADLNRHSAEKVGKLERMDSLQEPEQMKENIVRKIGQAAFDEAYVAIQTSTLEKTEVKEHFCYVNAIDHLIFEVRRQCSQAS